MTIVFFYKCVFRCFNRLDLPLYSSKNELEAGLKVILAMDTTGFTMD